MTPCLMSLTRILKAERLRTGLGITWASELFIRLTVTLRRAYLSMNPDEEDKIVEAMEQLRINYNLRQWRVCSLICESLADKFKSIAEKNEQ